MGIYKDEKGFSLIELIIVVTILGILSAAAVPYYVNYLYRTRVEEDIASAKEIIHVMKMYAASNGLGDAYYNQSAERMLEALEYGEMENRKMLSAAQEYIQDGFYPYYHSQVGIVLSFSASSERAGKYAGEYRVSDSGSLPHATVGGDANTALGSSE